jgi:hypothetical protein
MITAIIASTGTMQSAKIHPLNAAGFDKTILLITTLMMTGPDEPDHDEKHSDGSPNIFRHSHAPTKREQSVKLFAT